MGTAAQPQRTMSDVLQDIVSNIQQIIRSEFVLAKVEVTEKAQKASKPAAITAAGVVLAFYGLGFLLLAAIYALSLAMPTWLAALIIGFFVVILAGIFVGAGISALKRIDPVPEKTVRTVKENVQWAKDRIK